MIDMIENEKSAARYQSVGADCEQPMQIFSTNIISESNQEINFSEEKLDELLKEIERKTDPNRLNTMSMTELYERTYPGKPPIIDAFLYPEPICLRVLRRWENPSLWDSWPTM